MIAITRRHLCSFKRSAILLLVSVLAGTLAPRLAQAQQFTCAEELVMAQGQTLATLAARAFGTQDGVADIIAATNARAEVDASYTLINDPDAVEAGWKICIPDATTDDEPVMTLRPGPHRSALGANEVTSNKGKLARSQVALEQNSTLMESVLAERQGEDGVYPLTIEYLRRQSYPGSALTVEDTLPGGSNYSQYLVSYQSEGLKIYAAMTVPAGEKPAGGWPVIIFNHGYIAPAIYRATERYTQYVDAIARHGYIVLRPDLRGHGDSEGEALGAYGDPGYTIDVLNAIASIKQYANADPNRIGMWGHSMGGYLTARAMVVSRDIKAGVIWGGVVAPYDTLVDDWDASLSTVGEGEMPVPDVLISAYGTPQQNPGFWSTLSATSYAGDLSGPVQLHHGTADSEVPLHFSDLYYADLIAAGQTAEYYVYPGDDHNISSGFDVAMRRTLEFFDTYVKQLTPTINQLQASSQVQLVP